MKINENELRVCVDVDGTLISYNPTRWGKLDPIIISYYGVNKELYPMPRNIELLKSYKQRGYEVLVHSANGWRWAKSVVEVLNLQEYVHEIATKPLKYVDDLPADSWMQRVFIPED